MSFDEETEKQVASIFRTLNTVGAAKAFPKPLTLKITLKKILPKTVPNQKNIGTAEAAYFMTGAVDMWLRGVHSFLVSAALTGSSPIWASVSGYYASHYTVRGLAHLLGHFQLFNDKKKVRLNSGRNGYFCEFDAKDGSDHEHKFYWKMVKRSDPFKGNDLFTENNAGVNQSDVAHRNHANYSDHLGVYPNFAPLAEQAIKDRIERISKIVLHAPPLPRTDQFPDLEFVQLAAYHRLIAFRTLLDGAVGPKNRFWNVHRTPTFAQDYMDFQLATSDTLAEMAS